MQMKIDQKKEQIKYFESKVKEKEEKLVEVEKKINTDKKVFEQFLDKNKLETKNTIKYAEKETNEKLKVIE